ncbi:Glutaminyl-peptide cyclotransferase [Aphelenchoides fujianensis]|nr:Glutaminyl-peptide cyclotransferase [Aphelenchoides fujianensis]
MATIHCFLLVLWIPLVLATGGSMNPNGPPPPPRPPPPFVPGLLGKMLRASGYKTPVPTRNVAMNFNLTTAEIEQFAALTSVEKFRVRLKPLLVERQVGTKAHEQVAKYIEDTLRPLDFEWTTDEFEAKTPMGRRKFRNLIATFAPKAPHRLVLACHYDSKIMENHWNECPLSETFIGATDSAVPCAMLLDLATTLHSALKKADKMPIALQLLFLDGEEAFAEWSPTDSLYGARHLARRWSPEEMDRINTFVLLDLLGAANPQVAHTMGHGTKGMFEKIVEIEKTLNKTGHLKPVPPIFFDFELPEGVQDDFVPFRSRRVPIMHLISVPFPSVWHTPEDNENALDFDVIHNLLSVLRVFVGGYLGLRP